jgi:hypothetical protein
MAICYNRYSRREFFHLTAAGLVSLGAPPLFAAMSTDAREADLVVFNANVYTVDSAKPRAEAFAIRSGRFFAVGTTAD